MRSCFGHNFASCIKYLLQYSKLTYNSNNSCVCTIDCKYGRIELIWIAINDHIHLLCLKLIKIYSFMVIPKEMPIQLAILWKHIKQQPKFVCNNLFYCISYFSTEEIFFIITAIEHFNLHSQLNLSFSEMVSKLVRNESLSKLWRSSYK